MVEAQRVQLWPSREYDSFFVVKGRFGEAEAEKFSLAIPPDLACGAHKAAR